MEKENNKIISATIFAAVILFIFGILVGCMLMFICNKEAMRHYNQCQEQELLKTISEMRDEKSWYIKEGKDGKIKVVQYSVAELDSLSSEIGNSAYNQSNPK